MSYDNDSKSSVKESLSDLGIDHEERDKIIYSLEDDESSKLKVDYSEFANHTFFGSAYSNANFALFRLMDQYPWSGELKEKNEWRKGNTGYENWFFDNFPKQQGYANFVSGSSNTSIYILDNRKDLNPLTTSLTIEAAVKFHENVSVPQYLFCYTDELANNTNKVEVYLSSSKNIHFNIVSASNHQTLTASYHSYISSSHFLSFVYDAGSSQQFIYIDGAPIASRSMSTTFNELNINSYAAHIGAASSSIVEGMGLSASVDDFRYWLTGRSSELIKRNYYKTINANHSGALKVYYKFDETSVVNTTVIDYSGNEITGKFTGSFTFATNMVSGTLGAWFKCQGEPIYDLANSRTNDFISDQRLSGTAYDQSNNNFIFKIVPSYMIDFDNSEDQQRFLLLLARHYDKLKLYIEQLGNVLNTRVSEYDVTPDNLLNTVANHFGFDIGDIFENSNALQYYYGEDVLSSGSLESTTIQQIKNELKRNVLNNLVYILKSKGTRESIVSILRTLGLDESIVSVNEYSRLSGGIQTTRNQKAVERRVCYLSSSSNIFVTSSVYSHNQPRTYELRVLFNTASLQLTSSVFSIFSSSTKYFYMETERENLTSSNAIIKLYYSGASASPVTSSLLNIYDNNWVNFVVQKGASHFGFNAAKLNFDVIDYNFSASASTSGAPTPAISDFAFTFSIGSAGDKYFDGHVQEFRAWNYILSSSEVILDHTKDFDSLSLLNFTDQISSSLLCHLKLNDKTGSAAGSGSLHDYSNGTNGSTYGGFTSSADANFHFPGKYIDKLEPGTSYDFGINNDKVRVRNTDVLTRDDLIYDIPYVSVDISPVNSLNKEIVKWLGGLEKFNNIIGQPYQRYRGESTELNHYRQSFFMSKINSKINFKAYFDMLKWFDTNFSLLIKQVTPLHISNTISNFSIEPHLFEINKVASTFPSRTDKISNVLEATATALPDISGQNEEDFSAFGPADPGRFGSPASSSATSEITNIIDYSYLSNSTGDTNFNYGTPFANTKQTKILNDYYSSSLSNTSLTGYGNGFYVQTISCSNYEKNVLNAWLMTSTSIGVIGTPPDDGGLYAAYDRRLSNYTSSFIGVKDQRWLWTQTGSATTNPFMGTNYKSTNEGDGHIFDSGIGYGGAWGQLYSFSQKSVRGRPPTANGHPLEKGTHDTSANIGDFANVKRILASNFTSFGRHFAGESYVSSFPVMEKSIFINGRKILENAWPGVALLKEATEPNASLYKDENLGVRLYGVVGSPHSAYGSIDTMALGDLVAGSYNLNSKQFSDVIDCTSYSHIKVVTKFKLYEVGAGFVSSELLQKIKFNFFDLLDDFASYDYNDYNYPPNNIISSSVVFSSINQEAIIEFTASLKNSKYCRFFIHNTMLTGATTSPSTITVKTYYNSKTNITLYNELSGS